MKQKAAAQPADFKVPAYGDIKIDESKGIYLFL
jgi:hypothetical protein